MVFKKTTKLVSVKNAIKAHSNILSFTSGVIIPAENKTFKMIVVRIPYSRKFKNPFSLFISPYLHY